MTRVDFYVIDNADETAHRRLVCRLAERAWREGHRVHIHCDTNDLADALDDLLWTYKDTSFLPHDRGSVDAAHPAPVVIGATGEEPASHEVLINLAADVPAFFSRFERVMETAGAGEGAREAARQRYRYYQERGYSLNTHKLDARGG